MLGDKNESKHNILYTQYTYISLHIQRRVISNVCVFISLYMYPNIHIIICASHIHANTRTHTVNLQFNEQQNVCPSLIHHITSHLTSHRSSHHIRIGSKYNIKFSCKLCWHLGSRCFNRAPPPCQASIIRIQFKDTEFYSFISNCASSGAQW